MTTLTEADVEQAALGWLECLGWKTAYGPDIAPEAPGAERTDYREVVLEGRLRDALSQLNPDIPSDALEDAYRKLTRPEESTIETRNRAFHRMLAVNQYAVRENRSTRRLDVVLFVNGLPLGVVELKNQSAEAATTRTAWQQLQTYKAELGTLFSMNEVCIVSDGVEARIGTLTATWEWFKPWRTISGEGLADKSELELEVMLKGVCDRGRFLRLVRDFIVFEDNGGRGTLSIGDCRLGIAWCLLVFAVWTGSSGFVLGSE